LPTTDKKVDWALFHQTYVRTEQVTIQDKLTEHTAS